MRVCIYGGSFDPIHAGHLELARHALSELNVDRFFFVPSSQNPLKVTPSSSTKKRLQILRVAVRVLGCAEVSTYELDRPGKSYTVDTLRYFQRFFGRKAVLYFLAGADTLLTLPQWKSIKEVFRLCRFVVGSRQGYLLESSYPVIQMPFGALPVSSTQMRKSAREV